MDAPTAIVYGPVRSRRFGRTLGVNLTRGNRTFCNFKCPYCPRPSTNDAQSRDFATPAQVIAAVDEALQHHEDVDTIVVAGNGEPTLHPAFAPIADGLWHARRRYAPGARLALLSNGSTLDELSVACSLSRFDIRCMKLDAGDATTFRVMTGATLSLGRVIADLRRIGALTLQSVFVHDTTGVADNTTPRAVDGWLETVGRVGPACVDIYTMRRPPACSSLRGVPAQVLEGIADRVRSRGITARVFA